MIVSTRTVATWEWLGEIQEDNPGWTSQDISTVVERINRGAQLLDEQKPGWEDEVNPHRLKMSDGMFCIIGQTYGSYDEYIGVPFGMDGADHTARKAIDHGFLTDTWEGGDVYEPIPYALLDIIWVYLLQIRAEVDNKVFLELPPEIPRNVRLQTIAEMEAAA